MKFPIRLRCRALGGLELEGEIELPDDLFGEARRETLTESELRERWGCSSRTLKRFRDERRIPYQQPSARRYIYRLADVEAYERSRGTERGRLRPRG